ncbi:MAG: hypothetical protein FJ102_24740, partial [Deltaproteobacteria bacterium]|nr:hypothetical protein [Deltaproteobacteria bacterium]
MLSGLWEDDLERALDKHIQQDRRSAWGIAEMSRNPFKSIASQVGGVLYSSPPVPLGLAGAEQLSAEVAGAGYWQIQQRASVDLVGLRETVCRCDYTERGGLLFRPVSPELVVARALPEAPDQPVVLEELQLRAGADGAPRWCWEVLDVTDLDNPVQAVVSGDRKHDLTGDYLAGPRSGPGYQFRAADGKPFVPGVLYHAERTGRLWDCFHGIEA